MGNVYKGLYAVTAEVLSGNWQRRRKANERPYKVLNVSRDASTETIKQAYRNLRNITPTTTHKIPFRSCRREDEGNQ